MPIKLQRPPTWLLQARATAQLAQRRGALRCGVKALIAQETLDEAQLRAILAAKGRQPEKAANTAAH